MHCHLQMDLSAVFKQIASFAGGAQEVLAAGPTSGFIGLGCMSIAVAFEGLRLDPFLLRRRATSPRSSYCVEAV